MRSPVEGLQVSPRPKERWRPEHGTRAYQRLRRRILDSHGWRCSACGRAGRLELHHVVPWSAGGPDTPENLTPLCRPCHFAEHGVKRGPDRREWKQELKRRLES